MEDAKLLDGRKWSVDGRGITSLTRRYLIERDALPSGDESEETATFEGVPAIGTPHEANENLVVSGYEVEEGQDALKKYVVVTAKYSAADQEFSGGSATTAAEAVESWGWRSASVSRDLTHDFVSGAPVLNTFGDPFDTVPQVDRPSPVFQKTVKYKSRKSGWVQLVNCINDATVTIGGVECAPYTLRVVQVDEERLIGDEYGFKYRYSVSLQWLSNKVKLGGASTETEIGWDVAVVNQGCRGMVAGSDGTFTPGRFADADADGNMVPVSLPVLMDGNSKRLDGGSAAPYMLRIRAYARASIPGEFYSEPS